MYFLYDLKLAAMKFFSKCFFRSCLFNFSSVALWNCTKNGFTVHCEGFKNDSNIQHHHK